VVGYRPLLEKVPESPLALDQPGQNPIKAEGIELLSQGKGQVAQTRKVAFLRCDRALRLFFSRALRAALRHAYSLSNPKVRGGPESRRAQGAALLQAGQKVFAAAVPDDALADLVALADVLHQPAAFVSGETRESESPSYTTNIPQERAEHKRNMCGSPKQYAYGRKSDPADTLRVALVGAISLPQPRGRETGTRNRDR